MNKPRTSNRSIRQVPKECINEIESFIKASRRRASSTIAKEIKDPSKAKGSASSLYEDGNLPKREKTASNQDGTKVEITMPNRTSHNKQPSQTDLRITLLRKHATKSQTQSLTQLRSKTPSLSLIQTPSQIQRGKSSGGSRRALSKLPSETERPVQSEPAKPPTESTISSSREIITNMFANKINLKWTTVEGFSSILFAFVFFPLNQGVSPLANYLHESFN